MPQPLLRLGDRDEVMIPSGHRSDIASRSLYGFWCSIRRTNRTQVSHLTQVVGAGEERRLKTWVVSIPCGWCGTLMFETESGRGRRRFRIRAG
jgi:membrane-associated phospholipid phosphatase